MTPDQHRRAVLAACERHGVTVTRIGNVWSLRSPFVDILTRDLSLVRPVELRPYVPTR